mgnify:FL=1
MKNRVLYLSMLFLLTFCISTKVEAKKIYVQKDIAYSLNQFSKGKVKVVKYDKKYIKIKNGKVIPKKKGKTALVLKTKSNKKNITIKIVKKVCFGVSKTIYCDVGNRVNLKFTAKEGVSYSSSNKKVAKVSKKGIVTLLKRGKATIKAKYLGKTYQVQVVCRASLVGKVFMPNLSNIATVVIRRIDGTDEHTCTKLEMINILDMIRCRNWYSYVETPDEKKMNMSHQISMYDSNGNKTVVIEVNTKADWIRVPEEGSYSSSFKSLAISSQSSATL